jgi:hypothetical protein
MRLVSAFIGTNLARRVTPSVIGSFLHLSRSDQAADGFNTA